MGLKKITFNLILLSLMLCKNVKVVRITPALVEGNQLSHKIEMKSHLDFSQPVDFRSNTHNFDTLANFEMDKNEGKKPLCKFCCKAI